MEFFESFEFAITAVIYGSQNKRAYDIERWGEAPEKPLKYPFFAVEQSTHTIDVGVIENFSIAGHYRCRDQPSGCHDDSVCRIIVE